MRKMQYMYINEKIIKTINNKLINKFVKYSKY